LYGVESYLAGVGNKSLFCLSMIDLVSPRENPLADRKF